MGSGFEPTTNRGAAARRCASGQIFSTARPNQAHLQPSVPFADEARASLQTKRTHVRRSLRRPDRTCGSARGMSAYGPGAELVARARLTLWHGRQTRVGVDREMPRCISRGAKSKNKRRDENGGTVSGAKANDADDHRFKHDARPLGCSCRTSEVLAGDVWLVCV